MKALLKYFPRHANLYRARVENAKEMFKFINKCNGFIDCYYSLYDVQNYYIDKVVYDLDNKNSLKNVRKLHEYFLKEDIKHLMIFTGRGFHFYFFTKNYMDVNNTKGALKNAQLHFIKKLNLSYSSERNADVDNKLIGDVKRMIRIPNTVNKKVNLYAIPIDDELLNYNISIIRKNAETQNFTYTYYGSKLVDLSKFDYVNDDSSSMSSNNLKYFTKNCWEIMLPCMRDMLLKPELVKNQVRFYFAKGCRELLIHPDICDELARKHWSDTKDSSGKRTKYDEFVQEKQINYAYDNDDTFFPKCEYIKKLGFCEKECNRKIYKLEGVSNGLR